MYVAGQEFNGSKYVAKLWKNGNAMNLTDGSNHAQAHSVFVLGNDVYAAGNVQHTEGDAATLWKNGTAQQLATGEDSYAYSVFVR